MWLKEIRGADGQALRFWRECPALVEMHGELDQKELHRTIPIGMHGDAGKWIAHESLMTVSWNSLLAQDGECTMAKRFLLAAWLLNRVWCHREHVCAWRAVLGIHIMLGRDVRPVDRDRSRLRLTDRDRPDNLGSQSSGRGM